jgi:hypothetical protein
MSTGMGSRSWVSPSTKTARWVPESHVQVPSGVR